METKNFKCKDEVIYRIPGGEWYYGIFSHYKSQGLHLKTAVINGNHYNLETVDILPYEGNEHLVGTTDSPEEEVRLEEGETLLCTSKNGLSLIDEGLDVFHLRRYKSIHTNLFNGEWSFAIKFSDFNPNDMEETKAKILCVKNGKIVRYKG